MADWNGLTTTAVGPATTFTQIKDMATDCATMFKNTATNIPTDAIRLNRSTNRLEYWTGSAWAIQPFDFTQGDASAARTSLGLGALALKSTVDTADITNGAVTIAKITGLGALAQKNTIATADIDAGAVTLAKITGLGTMAQQSSNSVTITGGSAILSTLTSSAASFTDIQNITGGQLKIKLELGRNFEIYENNTLKALFPAGIGADTVLFSAPTDNEYILGYGSFAFKDINTYKVTYKSPFNFNNTGFSFTELTALDPNAAGASAVDTAIIRYVLTLAKRLGENKGISFTP